MRPISWHQLFRVLIASPGQSDVKGRDFLPSRWWVQQKPCSLPQLTSRCWKSHHPPPASSYEGSKFGQLAGASSSQQTIVATVCLSLSARDESPGVVAGGKHTTASSTACSWDSGIIIQDSWGGLKVLWSLQSSSSGASSSQDKGSEYGTQGNTWLLQLPDHIFLALAPTTASAEVSREFDIWYERSSLLNSNSKVLGFLFLFGFLFINSSV